MSSAWIGWPILVSMLFTTPAIAQQVAEDNPPVNTSSEKKETKTPPKNDAETSLVEKDASKEKKSEAKKEKKKEAGKEKKKNVKKKAENRGDNQNSNRNKSTDKDPIKRGGHRQHGAKARSQTDRRKNPDVSGSAKKPNDGKQFTQSTSQSAKKNRSGHAFIDRDGDGIHDGKKHRFRKRRLERLRKRKKRRRLRRGKSPEINSHK
ncbi:MAG: hypothetical protein GY847_06180 [Proteobacteria bacterium]|nr:hypothetical protein [Pseudomonadota bacterium]